MKWREGLRWAALIFVIGLISLLTTSASLFIYVLHFPCALENHHFRSISSIFSITITHVVITCTHVMAHVMAQNVYIIVN